MRTLNEQLLLERMRGNGAVSRGDLVTASGLSKPTVALALTSLERDQLVQLAGRRGGGRGRTARLYEIRPDAGFVLGLDVGREFVRGAVTDLSGAVRARESRPARSSSGAARIRELSALAADLLRDADVDGGTALLQTVVGSPGVVQPGGRALQLAASLPGWERPAVLRDLRRMFGARTRIENDVDAAAVAEQVHGHGRDVSTFAFVSVGTGIGMGLVIDGRLHRGAHGAAGEIAFLPLAEEHEPGDARRRGALEAAASAAAVVRAARRSGSRLRSARDVFAAAAAGDRQAREIVAGEAAIVARALAAVVAVVDPELIVLGGGIGRAPGFAAEVAGSLETVSPIVPEVRTSALGEDAVVDGCLAVGGEQLWDHVLSSRSRTEAAPTPSSTRA